MRPEAPRRPWCFGVERGCEANRFATDFQAEAYVGVLPCGGVAGNEAAGTAGNNVSVEASTPVLQGGVAA